MLKEAIELLLGIHKPMIDILDYQLSAPALLVRQGYEIKSLESYEDAPARIKQAVKLTAPTAFIDYTKRFQDADSTVIFVGDERFTTIFDYHESEMSPHWASHTATYSPKKSDQWEAWFSETSNNKKALPQLEFAFFLEERADDIHNPDPSDILTAATKFQQSQGMETVSFNNLDDGTVNFKFVKENKQDDAKFPHRFTVRIPVYEYHDPIDIDCRFRYRIQDGGVLKLWYQSVRDPKDIVRTHFAQVSAKIKENLDVPFYQGASS
jgi:uncharacterized protein YfdQ (DUF2303 family)